MIEISHNFMGFLALSTAFFWGGLGSWVLIRYLESHENWQREQRLNQEHFQWLRENTNHHENRRQF